MAFCCSCCLCCCYPCASSLVAVLLAHTEGLTPLELCLHDAFATYSAERPVTVRCRMLAALARRVLRLSALARRVAAAYGNACEQIFGPSHLISHRSKSNPGLSSRLTWHDFAYVTMAPCIKVHHIATIAYHRPPFLDPSGGRAR